MDKSHPQSDVVAVTAVNYRVLHEIQREVVIFDDRVVTVRDFQQESKAIAALP